MLMFWVIVALIATYERYIELACTWLPFYWETKVVLLLLILFRACTARSGSSKLLSIR